MHFFVDRKGPELGHKTPTCWRLQGVWHKLNQHKTKLLETNPAKFQLTFLLKLTGGTPISPTLKRSEDKITQKHRLQQYVHVFFSLLASKLKYEHLEGLMRRGIAMGLNFTPISTNKNESPCKLITSPNKCTIDLVKVFSGPFR